MVLWKCCTLSASKSGKWSSGHRTGKGQFSFWSQGKARPKNAQTTTQLHSSHSSSQFAQASKIMLKILQARLQQYVNCELSDVQAGFRKGRRTSDQIASIHWVIKKKNRESSRKTSTSASLIMPKPLTVWATSCGKFWKRWEYQTTWPAFWEICMQIKKQQLKLDMAQQTGSKSGKEYVKAVYSHTAYLTDMQSTSWETLGWVKHKLELRLP